MLFGKRQDYRTITTSWAHSTKYQLALSREFWLESIFISLTFTTGAVTISGHTADAFMNLLKTARLSITDATGNRKVLDVTGPALIEQWRTLVGALDRTTAGLIGAVTPANSTQYTITWPIFFRHPVLQDPYGAATMLPLPRLSNDPVLEIEIGAATDVASTTTNVFSTKGSIVATINRRDVTVPNFPYIPSELITYEQQWNSAGGKQYFDLPAIGTVTGILIQDYKGGTARTCILGSAGTSDEVGQDWSLEYLSTVIRRVPPIMLQNENDYTVELYPATWLNQPGSYFFDFLSDYANVDAFNVGSCLDLNPLVLSGGKARLIGSSIVTTASSYSRFTIHKLFGDLRALKFV